jgi:putative oxidoreductase
LEAYGKKMSGGSWLIAMLGRILLTSYFLKAGINNAFNSKNIKGLLSAKKIPFPGLVLFVVVFTEIAGSLAIIFNIYSSIAVIGLIIFTLAANFLICNYWTMEGLQRRNISFVFYANIAVIGGLLLMSSGFSNF